MTDNATFVRSLYEAWNDRDFDRQADAMAPDGTIEFVGSGQVFKGTDGARQYGQNWANGFPDGKVSIDNIVAAGDKVVVEYTGRGTHTGTLESAMGSMPATGKSVTLRLCDVYEIKDDKIHSQRSYLDTGSMMVQLGLAPAQSATTK